MLASVSGWSGPSAAVEGGAGLGEQRDRPLRVAQAELRRAQGHLHPGHGERVAGRLPLDLGRRPVQPLAQDRRERLAVLLAAFSGSRSWKIEPRISFIFVTWPAASRPRRRSSAICRCSASARRPPPWPEPAATAIRSCRRASIRPSVVPTTPRTSASSTSAAAVTCAPVPPHELPQPVGRRRRAGRDRLVVEEPLDVVGQADGRLVPPLPLLRQRLHHDPVEVAPHQPRQPRRLDRAGWRRGVGSASDVLIRLRRRRRLVLADHPQHLVERRLPDRLAVDRRRAGQQLVEDHAQRVDVAPGVDVQRVEARPARGSCTAACRPRCRRPVNSVLLGEPLPPVALATPKSITLGTGRPSCSVDQDVGGLEVAVDDPLLVGVLHRLADRRRTAPAARGGRGGAASQYSVIGMPLTSSMTK